MVQIRAESWCITLAVIGQEEGGGVLVLETY